jgi:putative tryptophan/tyrosine transport system substrate-binding protein
MRLIGLVLALGLVFAPIAAETEQIRRIGFLSTGTPSARSAAIEAFRQGLRDLGYIEGQNVTIEYRYAQDTPERQPALAAELVSLKVDVIVSVGATGTRAAKEATSTIPIVMAQDPDPVGSGFVASLAPSSMLAERTSPSLR